MDTIILSITGPGNFDFRDPSVFIPEIHHRTFKQISPDEIQTRNSKRPYLKKFILHPKKSTSEYRPQVEVYEKLDKIKDQVLYTMKITFSAQKILYGNSVQEVTEDDKKYILYKLQTCLRRFGIIVLIPTLEHAYVSAVHFSKNIFLPKNISMDKLLDELKKIDIHKTIEMSEKFWINGGRILQGRSGIQEYCFYDKIMDSLKHRNKNSQNNEVAFTEKYKLENKEIFRFEYRIKKGQTVLSKINKILERTPKTPVIFKDLFYPGLHKNMIIQSWENIIDKPQNQLALFEEEKQDNLSILVKMLHSAKDRGKNAHSMNTAFISYGIATILRNHDAKQLRLAIKKGWGEDHYERVMDKIKTARMLLGEIQYPDTIMFITREFEKFDIITLDKIRKSIY